VNVLIALIDPRHIHHDAAHRGPSPLSQFPRRTRQCEPRLAPTDRPRSAPRGQAGQPGPTPQHPGRARRRRLPAPHSSLTLAMAPNVLIT
jgi:hypothetical protein